MECIDELPAVPAAESAVVLGEEVFICRNTILIFQAVEAVMRIVEEDCPVDLCPGLIRLFVIRCREQLQHFIGILTEISADLLFIVFHIRMREENERTAFLGIVSMQNGLFIVHAALA